jgi:hypothetical protein
MSKLNDAIQALRAQIVARLDPSPAPMLTDAQVIIGAPDIDRLPFPEMVYLQPDLGQEALIAYAENETLLSLKAYILVKQTGDRKGIAQAMQSALDLHDALINAIEADRTLSGTALEATLTRYDIAPFMQGLLTTAAMVESEIEIQLTP